MTKVSFSDIFSGEYLIVINKYRERIQSILSKYDIAIFMARKAICFYEAMVNNNEILPTKCLVVSSRVLDYNFIKNYEKKKIAIIDDVVVKGDSLRKVASILSKCNIEADTYVVACEHNFGNNFNLQFSGCRLKETYTCLTTKAIYSFSAMITEYIESSMCPFNIDQPIYNGINDEKLKAFFTNVDAFDLSSGVQVKYGIESKVLYFTLNVNLADKQIQEIINKSILKIRFLSSGTKIKAIPFVLFQELSEDELNRLFVYIENAQILDFSSNDNMNIVHENKLKIINYFYSELLLIIFSKKFDFKFCKDISNDIIQFGEKTSSLYGNELKKVYYNSFKNCEILDVADFNFSKFHFSESIANVYRAIDDIDVDTQTYTNAEGRKLSDNKEKIVTNDYLETFIDTQLPSKRYIVSSVIDILIDKGMIVPAVVHSNNGIIRAYKLGEYSKLTREQFREFVCMLNLYQDLINDDIDRTEFEKLCVIYFTTAIHKNYFKQQTNYEDDCYSISYSLYGPRVSSGKVSYKVNSLSALATKLLSEEEKMMFESRDKKYMMNPIFKDNKNNTFLTMFAYRYAELRKLFQDQEGWDKYAYTYIQYLTLKAIGESNKSKFLSLCAELYQIVQINNDIFNVEEFDRNRHGLILSGINSGLWKYQCFKQNVLEKTFGNIANKDIKVAMSFGDDFNEENDKSIIWQTIIDSCGEVLYSIAYLLNEVINKYSLHSNFDIKNVDNSDAIKTKAKLIFTARDYYDKEFNPIRLKYENAISKNATKNIHAYVENEILMLKKRAQYILDLADLYLESNNPNYTRISKILVVYSKDSNLPEDLCADLQCIKIMGLENKFGKNYRCYILDNDSSGIPVLEDILNVTYSNRNIHFIVMNMSKWYEGFVHIGDRARGHFAVNILNRILTHIDNVPTNATSNMLTVVGKGFDKTFESGGFTFMRKEDSDIELDSEYVAEEYNIYKKTAENNKKQSISIGIICALDKELKAVLSRIEATFGIKRNIKIDQTWSNREYYYYDFNYNKIHVQLYVLEQRRQGNNSSSNAYSFIVRYSLDFIAFCGIAGSLNKKIGIGDVLIPTEIFDVTLKKEKDDEVISRGTVHKVNPKLLGFINSFMQNVSIRNIKMHSEPVVSDNTVIACKNSDIIRKVLLYNDKVAGVEMESAGIYEADYEAGQTVNGTMTIRGISDNADNIKNDDFHKIASNNAATVLCKFIKFYIDLSKTEI